MKNKKIALSNMFSTGFTVTALAVFAIVYSSHKKKKKRIVIEDLLDVEYNY